MYNRQKGLVPTITKILGMIIFVYPTVIVLLNALFKTATNHTPRDILVTFVAMAIVLGFPIWLSLLLIKLFPSVRILPNEVRYASLGILKGSIKWDEITELILFENEYSAVAFNKRGFYFINGSYFNKLYGVLIRHEDSILFFSPGTENLKEILSTISNNSNARIVKKKSRKG